MSPDPEERLALIQASQEMLKEERSYPSKRFVIYTVWVGPKYEKTSLGAKFELDLLPTDLRIVIEGVELERGTPAVGFFSLLFAPFHKVISPYIGGGIGTPDEDKNTRYQLFVGLEIGGDFFVEVKYVNEKEINTAVAAIYSIVGFKMSL